MQSLKSSIESLNQMSIEMIKNVDRMFRITILMLKTNNFDKKLYGEGKVIEEETNEYQIKIDELCVNIIARYQPTAIDLRTVIGVMHMNVDLERIGDLCINIMKTIRTLKDENSEIKEELVSIYKMSEKVLNMYDIFVKGYIEKDINAGYTILGLDDEIDDMKNEHMIQIKSKIKQSIDTLEIGIENLLISRNLERIADNITNLAESLVYIFKGEDLRHNRYCKGKL